MTFSFNNRISWPNSTLTSADTTEPDDDGQDDLTAPQPKGKPLPAFGSGKPRSADAVGKSPGDTVDQDSLNAALARAQGTPFGVAGEGPPASRVDLVKNLLTAGAITAGVGALGGNVGIGMAGQYGQELQAQKAQAQTRNLQKIKNAKDYIALEKEHAQANQFQAEADTREAGLETAADDAKARRAHLAAQDAAKVDEIKMRAQGTWNPRAGNVGKAKSALSVKVPQMLMPPVGNDPKDTDVVMSQNAAKLAPILKQKYGLQTVQDLHNSVPGSNMSNWDFIQQNEPEIQSMRPDLRGLLYQHLSKELQTPTKNAQFDTARKNGGLTPKTPDYTYGEMAANAQDKLPGMLAGATSGGLVGSMGGPVGTAVGSALGAYAGSGFRFPEGSMIGAEGSDNPVAQAKQGLSQPATQANMPPSAPDSDPTMSIFNLINAVTPQGNPSTNPAPQQPGAPPTPFLQSGLSEDELRKRAAERMAQYYRNGAGRMPGQG